MKKVKNICILLLFLAACYLVSYLLPAWAISGTLLFLLFSLLVYVVDTKHDGRDGKS